MKTILSALLSVFIAIAFSGALSAQTNPAPDRAEGEGPYERLIIRGATMIEGSGYPALGPVDIVIEGNRIEEVVTVGYPGVPIDEEVGCQALQVIGKRGHYLVNRGLDDLRELRLDAVLTLQFVRQTEEALCDGRVGCANGRLHL